MKVVFLCMADYAGAAYQVVRAINSIGRIEARQIVCHKNIYGFDADIVLPSVGTSYMPGGWKSIEDSYDYPEACELLKDADLIHCWNDEYHDYLGKADSSTKAFRGEFPVFNEKYKSCTFTGTWYRQNWATVNKSLLEKNIKLVVETEAFIMKEMPSVYIPHAIDCSSLIPTPVENRVPKSVGCYPHRCTTANMDIELLKSILKMDFPDWSVTLEKRTDHKERLKNVGQCMFFLQDMDTRMINYGRSALEAAVQGVPVINSVSPSLRELMPDIALIEATPDTLREVLNRVLREDYEELSRKTREWAVKYHDYSVVGEQYTKFFEELV